MHFRFKKSLFYCSWWSCTRLREWSWHWEWMDCPKVMVLWSLFSKDPLLIAWGFQALEVWVHIWRSWDCRRRVLLAWVERLSIYAFIHKGNNSHKVLANFTIIKAWIYQNASTSPGHCGETKPPKIWFNFSVGVKVFFLLQSSKTTPDRVCQSLLSVCFPWWPVCIGGKKTDFWLWELLYW